MKQLLIRTLSGIVYSALTIGSLLLGPTYFGIVFLIIVYIIMREYLGITLGKRLPIAQSLATIAGGLLFILSYIMCSKGLAFAYLLLPLVFILLIYISLLYSKDKEAYKDFPHLINSIIYIALPFSMCNLIAFDSGTFNGHVILSMMIILWSADVGAYLFGMTFGQKNGHKLFPSISPKKSWEGYIGGLISSIAAGIIIAQLGLLDLPVVYAIILALIINIFGTFGDLVESQLKRNHGRKDSGKIMPGHGGLLDRLDGALLAFPTAIIYLLLIL